jgi:hypothetical protein
VSPIFVRPVREQLEHDRLIRFLQAKYKKKLEAAINVGDERIAPVKIGGALFFPDVVLTDKKKLAGVVEVETGESVNNLEAMAQWAPFSRARVPFHLYVPVQGYDAARRLCDANQAKPAEVWTYRGTMDGFDLVRMFQDPSAAAPARAARASAGGKKSVAKKSSKKPVAKPAKKVPAKRAKTAARAKKAPARRKR